MSLTPRRQAAVTASSVPAVTLRMTTASGPSIVDCAPASSRDNTSRPSKSYPSRWPPTGPAQDSDRFGRFGSYGASTGPNRAANVAAAMTTAEAIPAGPVARSTARPRREAEASAAGMTVLTGSRPSAPAAGRAQRRSDPLAG